METKLSETTFKVDGEQQRNLAMKVLMFEDVLDSVLSDLLTHKLTD